MTDSEMSELLAPEDFDVNSRSSDTGMEDSSDELEEARVKPSIMKNDLDIRVSSNTAYLQLKSI